MDKKTLFGIVTAALYLGCEPKFISKDEFYEGYSRHDVDQVFRDDRGYRVYYDDGEGIVQELKYSRFFEVQERSIYEENLLKQVPEEDRKKLKVNLKPNHPHVVIIKDLPNQTQGFAHVLSFATRYNFDDGEHYPWNYYTFHHAEIHLPKDQNLSPGNEVYGGNYN